MPKASLNKRVVGDKGEAEMQTDFYEIRGIMVS